MVVSRLPLLQAEFHLWPGAPARHAEHGSAAELLLDRFITQHVRAPSLHYCFCQCFDTVGWRQVVPYWTSGRWETMRACRPVVVVSASTLSVGDRWYWTSGRWETTRPGQWLWSVLRHCWLETGGTGLVVDEKWRGQASGCGQCFDTVGWRQVVLV